MIQLGIEMINEYTMHQTFKLLENATKAVFLTQEELYIMKCIVNLLRNSLCTMALLNL